MKVKLKHKDIVYIINALNEYTPNVPELNDQLFDKDEQNFLNHCKKIAKLIRKLENKIKNIYPY